jgi:hypothetical protein
LGDQKREVDEYLRRINASLRWRVDPQAEAIARPKI